MKEEIKYLFHTMLHPVDGFEGVKFEGKGTIGTSMLLVFMFFLQNVIATAGPGFLFKTGDPDKISVPNILAISVGTIILWIVANWAVDSLMDAEGRTSEIIIVSTYSLLPYIIASLFITLISNFVSLEMQPFMKMVTTISIVWSVFMLVVGMYQIHQMTFGKTLGMLFLTILGMAIIIFLLVLVYSLYQQLYIFLKTIFSEIMFRV